MRVLCRLRLRTPAYPVVEPDALIDIGALCQDTVESPGSTLPEPPPAAVASTEDETTDFGDENDHCELEQSGEPYRSLGQPKILPTSGLLCSVASAIPRPELAKAIAPSCFRGQIPVRPRINGYFPFDPDVEQDAEPDPELPPSYVLSNDTYTALRYATLSRKVPRTAIERAKKKALAEAAKASPGKQFSEIDTVRIGAGAYSALLAEAHVDEREDPIFYCHDSGLVFISERSPASADEVAKNLGFLLQTPVKAFAFNVASAQVMGKWLTEDTPPEDFEFGRSALLCGANKARAKFDNHDLTSKEVLDHLTAGLYVSELQLIYKQLVQFTLTTTGFVKGIGIYKHATSEEASGLSGYLHEAILFSTVAIPAIHAVLQAVGGGFNHEPR